MGMKLTHVDVDTLGDHTAQGWWHANHKPKIQKYVVVTAKSAYPEAMQEAVEFFHEMGARQVHIIPGYVFLPW